MLFGWTAMSVHPNAPLSNDVASQLLRLEHYKKL